MSNSIHNGNESQQQGGKPVASLPRDAENEMLKDIEALAKRIDAGEVQAGDAQYDLKLNELSTIYQIKISGIKKTLKRLLPIEEAISGAQQEEQLDNDLNLLVEKDEPFTPQEIKAAEELLTKSDIFGEFCEDFKLTGYRASRELTDAGLMVLGRTLRHLSSGEYGHGKLGTGKTEFYIHAASFFPLAKTLFLTTFTEKFLFYAGGKEGNDLKGFLVIYGESDLADKKGEDTFKQKYLRQLLTENRITQGSVEQESRKNRAKYDRLNGPITVVITGVDSPTHFDPQTSSRLYCRHFKHTHDTIKQVLVSKAKRAANPRIEDTAKLSEKQRTWRCAFTLLKQLDPANSEAIQAIEIPFSGQLVFNKKRHTEADMRAFDRLIESIQVSALLNQKQRTLKGTTLVADWQDFIHVKAAFFSSIPAAKGLSHDLIDRFFELLEWWQKPDNTGKKSKREICDALNVDPNTGKKWISNWLRAELLEDKTETDKPTAKRYYEAAINAQSIGNQLLDDESLGIESMDNVENIASTGNGVPSENNSENLGTGDTSVWVSTENNKPEQAVPSDQANDQELGTCPSLVQLDISQLRPSKNATNSAIQDMGGACPANFEKGITANNISTQWTKIESLLFFLTPSVPVGAITQQIANLARRLSQSDQANVRNKLDYWAVKHPESKWAWEVVAQIQADMPDTPELMAAMFDGKVVK